MITKHEIGVLLSKSVEGDNLELEDINRFFSNVYKEYSNKMPVYKCIRCNKDTTEVLETVESDLPICRSCYEEANVRGKR